MLTESKICKSCMWGEKVDVKAMGFPEDLELYYCASFTPECVYEPKRMSEPESG